MTAEARHERLCNLESLDETCEACGYVSHDIPTTADNAHDELCCGGATCWWANDPKELCVTHTEPDPRWRRAQNSLTATVERNPHLSWGSTMR